ncbi:MAG TPA: acetyl-CoA C-acyltransferase [Firmicutes bacterium]|mgnify:FL=1|nr:acetyl-CoA C-acyltransferase [Bacillota bacterium]HBK69789.1 acetyl-CoA C-acyltransferase [Bacillota bacterium]HBT16976.1 acetyl-CoA C-acyltransferase [Bacillota bacterium]
MEKIAITSAVRTAVGRFGGSLKDISPIDLAALVINESIKRAGLEQRQIERVVLGENIQTTAGGNPARRAHLAAGLPVEIDDYTMNMNCASGLRAIISAAQDVLLGEIDIAVAGGMENMSQTPYFLEKARFGYRLGNGNLVDYLADYILGDAGPMAENVAAKYNISREQQDEWAFTSQQRAGKAIADGKFVEEILPVMVPGKKPFEFKVDEHPRPDTTLEKLASLRPVFKKDGSVTAGNSSGINDGAAAVTVMTEKKAKELGCKPLGFVEAWASVGVEPDLFGIGPIPAVRKLLAKTGLKLSDIALIELNEAFASPVVASIRELGLDPEKVNVNGGAIALGHPVGATGVILLMKALNELRRRDQKYAIVTMCIGSGQGIATLVSR